MPYCMPGAACWPKPEVWSAFNQSVDGMLHGLSTSLITEQCTAPHVGRDGTLLTEQGWGICMQHHACYYEGCKQERPPDLPTYSVEALTVDHVQAAVRFANVHSIAVSIKTSGHNYAGSSTARGSLLIWLKNLRRFGEFGPLTDSCGTTHPLTQHLGGGEAWGDAYKAAVNNGYTVVGGGSANVGCCGGWLAGSGLSWSTRNNGFGLDNVLQYEVVTADGERKIVDACSEPDLYWALRGGGGGSFGVVTSLYYRAFPTTPVVMMRLSHNGLSSSSLLGSWCWEKVQAAGGTLNASNLPNRSACFPGAEDWVGVIDSWITELLPGGAVDILNLHRKWGGYWSGPTLAGAVGDPTVGLLLYFHGSEQEMRDTDDLPARLQAWLDSMDAAVVSKYGLRVEYEQYDSYYEARQEGNNCSDGSIVAGDPRHTACLRFGDAQDVYGNSEYAHVLKPQGLFTWTMPRVVMQNVSRARQLLHDMYFYRLEVTHGYIVGQATAEVPPDATSIHPAMRSAVALFIGLRDDWLSQQAPEGCPCYNHDGAPLRFGPAPEDWQEAYWGPQLPRLNQIKHRYDPHGRFNSFQGIGYRPLPATPALVPGCGSSHLSPPSNVLFNLPILNPPCGEGCTCATGNLNRKLLFASLPSRREHAIEASCSDPAAATCPGHPS